MPAPLLAPPSSLLTLCAALRDAGGRAFLVGGAVRDALLGLPVRDYDVEVEDQGEWICVVSERGNYRRFRAHDFPSVQTRRLRLVVRSTNEDGWPARVYEIRAYGLSESNK